MTRSSRSNAMYAASSILVGSCASGLSSVACADEPGSIAVTLGWIAFNPHSTSGSLHVTEVGGQQLDLEQPGTGVSVSKTQTVTMTVAYALSNSLWAQAVAAWPVNQDLRGTGTLDSIGVIGRGQQLSPGLLLKYDFNAFSNFVRPFVSAGFNYTTYRKTRVVNDAFRQATYGPNSHVSSSASSSVNPVANVGADFRIDNRWFINGVVIYAPIRTKITVRAEDTALGTIKTRTDVRLKSVAFSVNLGYVF